MSPNAGADAERRVPLSRERLLRGAIAVADAADIGALTMRSLAQELGVKPMSLYHHVANKEEILDGIIDIVFSEIEPPPADADWRSAMRHRAISVRSVLPTPHLGDPAHGVASSPDRPRFGITTR